MIGLRKFRASASASGRRSTAAKKKMMAQPETAPRASSSGRAPALPRNGTLASAGERRRARTVSASAAADLAATTARALTRWSIPFRAAALPERVRALVRMQAAPQFQSREKGDEGGGGGEAAAGVAGADAGVTGAPAPPPPPPAASSSFSFATLGEEPKGTGPETRGARSSLDIEPGAKLADASMMTMCSGVKNQSGSRRPTVTLSHCFLFFPFLLVDSFSASSSHPCSRSSRSQSMTMSGARTVAPPAVPPPRRLVFKQLKGREERKRREERARRVIGFPTIQQRRR